MRFAAGALLLAIACAGNATIPLDATLAGTVRRGPITPVCRQGEPCDAPFAASFDVRLGARVVASFASGADGRFLVAVPAGELTVVPHADAPLMHPTSQARTVVTRAGARTEVELAFDTGIR